MTIGAWRVYRAALSVDAVIFHIHDPELLPFGLMLQMRGYRVIYDAHESVPDDVIDREYLPVWARRSIARLVGWVEQFVAKRLTAVVAATPHIAERLRQYNLNTVAVNNFPHLSDILIETVSRARPERKIVSYIGGIARIRGVMQMIEAADIAGVKLVLAGKWNSESERTAAQALLGWRRVEDRGYLSRSGALSAVRESCAALVVFHPVANHIHAQPNKLFEYMAAGVPVIASGFPLWREIVELNKCGICVNPLDPSEIASAILWIINHPSEAAAMGMNGQAAVQRHYNWGHEEKKLICLYSHLCSTSS